MTGGSGAHGAEDPTTMLDGTWTYRSYVNNPALVGDDPAAALADIFGEGIFTLASASHGAIGGTLDMSGLILDLDGSVTPGRDGGTAVAMIGRGRPGTPTEGWQYDYHGSTAYHWPTGIDQAPALVGTVLRAKPHGGGKAGVTASFVAVWRGAAGAAADDTKRASAGETNR